MLTFFTLGPLVYDVDTVFWVSILLIMSDEGFVFLQNAPWSLSLISSFLFPDYYFLHLIKSVAFYSTLNSSYNKYCV
jgi:hypothetical protein